MPRDSRKVQKRKILPDLIYHSVQVQKFINKMMRGGNKATTARIVYRALEQIQAKTSQPALEVFQKALTNVTPQQEVKPRRVGGATYQVPLPVRAERGETLAMRWLIQAARSKKGKPMVEDLAEELLAASQGQGDAYKKKADTHKMAEGNRAFAHFRW